MDEKKIHHLELAGVVVLLVSLTIGMVWFVANQKNNKIADQATRLAQQEKPNPNLGPEYKEKLKKMWNGVLISISTKNKQQLADKIDYILELKVPEDLKDFHLKLVMALSQAQDALGSSNPAALPDAVSALSRIEKETQWLN